MKTKLSPKILRAAAKDLSTAWDMPERGCCVGVCAAIDYVTDNKLEARPHHELIAQLFRPPGLGNGSFWWSDDYYNDRAREARIIALLLAALLVEEGYSHD